MATRQQLRHNLMKRRHIRTDAENLDEHLELFLKSVMPQYYNDVRRLFTLNVLGRIIERSPVDRGFYRFSHNTSVGRPDTSVPEKRSRAKTGATARKYEMAPGERGLKMVAGGATQAAMAQDLWITTNLPYSPVIENGGYPDPPTKGSYVKRGRPGGPGWHILSTGGYSRQAPRGVYRVSVKDEVKSFNAEAAA